MAILAAVTENIKDSHPLILMLLVSIVTVLSMLSQCCCSTVKDEEKPVPRALSCIPSSYAGKFRAASTFLGQILSPLFVIILVFTQAWATIKKDAGYYSLTWSINPFVQEIEVKSTSYYSNGKDDSSELTCDSGDYSSLMETVIEAILDCIPYQDDGSVGCDDSNNARNLVIAAFTIMLVSGFCTGSCFYGVRAWLHLILQLLATILLIASAGAWNDSVDAVNSKGSSSFEVASGFSLMYLAIVGSILGLLCRICSMPETVLPERFQRNGADSGLKMAMLGDDEENNRATFSSDVQVRTRH